MIEQIYNETLRYKELETQIHIVGCIDDIRDVVIPSKIKEKPVTTIGERAFSEQKMLTKVVLSEGIHTIEQYAFRECRGLTSIILPKSVTKLGDHTFYNCRNLQMVTVSEALEVVGDGAFKNCDALQKIILLQGEKNTALKRILPDISGNVTVVTNDAKVFFPKDDVYLSDFSTRLYMDVRYSVGNHYRQTVGTDGLDYERYDSYFSMAQNELATEYAIGIALNRLQYPHLLTMDALEAYQRYLHGHIEELCMLLFQEQDMETFCFLIDEQFYAREEAEQVLTLCYEQEQTEAAAYMLAYKHKYYNKRDVVFEL